MGLPHDVMVRIVPMEGIIFSTGTYMDSYIKITALLRIGESPSTGTVCAKVKAKTLVSDIEVKKHYEVYSLSVLSLTRFRFF